MCDIQLHLVVKLQMAYVLPHASSVAVKSKAHLMAGLCCMCLGLFVKGAIYSTSQSKQRAVMQLNTIKIKQDDRVNSEPTLRHGRLKAHLLILR